ncbi:PKD domain-containing protein [Zobellia laminariae]|uniref:PKD domain-containing protein n=1 Tax=Zobellia laminariae TaxID=248906 RepID=UPI0012D9A70E|nr:PKD domain-containing protein [Zobellia laminariae]
MENIKSINKLIASLSLLAIVSSCDPTIDSLSYDLPEANSKADETPPSASFSATETEDYLTYTFGNTSSSATAYTWSYGDGNASGGVDGMNTYSTVGTYTVTLTASDNLGVTSTSTLEIEVVEPEEPAAIIPEILNGDFANGQDDWKIADFTGGTTSPFNSSSDGSFFNYDGSDNGSKTAGAKWTQGTSAGEWVSASTRYAYQALTVTPNTEYILEYEYAIKDDTATDPTGGRRIVGEILDGHFADGVDAVASSEAGARASHVGTNAGGKTSFTLVKEQFTSNASGEISIWIYGVTPVDAYVDNVKVYPVD